MHCKNRASYKRLATNNRIIAIDGPAGSGKSTVAKALAKRLGFLYVDTGAMYRAITLKAIKEKVSLVDEQGLVNVAERANIQLVMQRNYLKVILDGKDVSRDIRRQALTEKVYLVARTKGVRAQMVKKQRSLAKGANGAVLEGRDIGTVVFPNAKYKFYLDAKFKERIRRRFKELQLMGQKIDAEDIAKDIRSRDRSDLTREIAPLAKAKDAIYIDTTDLGIEEVTDRISCFLTSISLAP